MEVTKNIETCGSQKAFWSQPAFVHTKLPCFGTNIGQLNKLTCNYYWRLISISEPSLKNPGSAPGYKVISKGVGEHVNTFDFLKTYILFFCRGSELLVSFCLSWGVKLNFSWFKEMCTKSWYTWSVTLTCDIFSLGLSANNALMIMTWETQSNVVGAGSDSKWVTVYRSREVGGGRK